MPQQGRPSKLSIPLLFLTGMQLYMLESIHHVITPCSALLHLTRSAIAIRTITSTKPIIAIGSTDSFLRAGKEQDQQDPQQEQERIDAAIATRPTTGGVFDFLFNPYQSKIPKEIEADIYAAEANTPAARNRSQRIAIYIMVCSCFVLAAFFNVFLSELRQPLEDGTIVTLSDAGFGWVEEQNAIFRFLFLNKIGGGLLLFIGVGAGFLAEAEFDTRRITAEAIFEEMVRRRSQGTERNHNINATSKTTATGTTANRKRSKKRRSGKEAKRLNALAEITTPSHDEPRDVIIVSNEGNESSSSFTTTTTTTTTTGAVSTIPPTTPTPPSSSEPTPSKKKGGGLVETLKGFYNQADTLAASQALLLNKKLEEQGILEKITDETGLVIIGKEAAARQEQKKKSNMPDSAEQITSSSSSSTSSES